MSDYNYYSKLFCWTSQTDIHRLNDSYYTFNNEDYFYYKVKLDYNDKTYAYYDMKTENKRIGINGDPIKWYEYVNIK